MVRHASTQHGATLVTAMVFLVVVSLLSITAMRSSTIGVRMSLNEESRFAAIQATQALTEAIAATPAATPVIGDAGFANCTNNETGCDRYTIPLPPGFVADAVAAGHLSGRVERLSPPEKPPPRTLASSVDKFSAASFQIIGTFDRTQDGLGRTQLVEGVLVLVPKN